MLTRFCLYGFLKNQRYFEPFLVLVFLEKGLSFFEIGVLIAFREVAINLFELPSGAIADLYGRRRSMLFSFTAYLASFAVFATSTAIWTLFAAMWCFALGEAFRSGTHKAMILDWLELQGRSDEKTKVYGTTRSWSQLGSAVSVLIAAVIVFVEASYSWVFWYTMIPYTLGWINFLGYPSELDGKNKREGSIGAVARHLITALRQCWRRPELRRLLLESSLQKGTYRTVKDYLQPILQQAALLVPFFASLEVTRRAAILVGLVYFGLYFLSAISSRQAYRIRDAWGGAHRASIRVWVVTLVAYVLLAVAFIVTANSLAIAMFVVLAVLQNLWLPIYLARIDDASDRESGATVLSIDTQLRSLLVAVVAPLLGWAADRWGVGMIAVMGIITAVAALGVVCSWKLDSTKI